jgi:hypothetical protein
MRVNPESPFWEAPTGLRATRTKLGFGRHGPEVRFWEVARGLNPASAFQRLWQTRRSAQLKRRRPADARISRTLRASFSGRNGFCKNGAPESRIESSVGAVQ